MAYYIVGYDKKSGEDYSKLINYLQTAMDWWHCLDSTWIVQTELTALDLANAIWQHLDQDDKLLVAEYFPTNKGGSSAWCGFGTECSDWLQSRM